MATSDGTLLCVFSGSDCIIVDDFDQKVQQTIPIKTIWPGLPASMGSDLDAVCRDDLNGQFIFFKDQQCAANNFKTNRWANGSFSEFFSVISTGGAGAQIGRFCGSFEDVSQTYGLRLHGYVGGVLEYLNGKPLDLTTPGNQITLGGPTPIAQESGWQQMVEPHHANILPRFVEVGCSHVFWPSQMPGGTGQLTPAMLVKDNNPGVNAGGSIHNCTFINTTDFTPLTQMWQGWEDSWKVDAVTRVDASVIQKIDPNPDHGHHHHHHHGDGDGDGNNQGPGPVVSPNPLCNELPNIMKSVCSLTLLLHKAIDACYPQSSWPTQPYPDGCSVWGGHKHKHHGCGCQGSQHKTDGSDNN